MKKKTILYLVSLFFLSVPLTGRGQDKKAWEIGAGGSLINWSRVSVTGFQSTPDNYMYNLKANHLMGGANLYVARELNRWFYLDLQGTVGVAPFVRQRSQPQHSTIINSLKFSSYNFLF